MDRPPSELAAADVARFVAPTEQESFRQGLFAVLEGRESSAVFAHGLLAGQQYCRRVVTSLSRLECGRGVPLFCVGLVKDLSIQVSLEERLRSSQRLETLGRLLSSVAHDFSNLLAVILGYSKLVSQELSDEE